MKTLKLATLAIACSLLGTLTSLEQNPQPNQLKKVPNLYDIQREAEKAWEDGKSRKGTGYKPYKRWEHFMQTRTANAEGDIKNMGKEVWNAINNNSAYRFGLSGEVCTRANWQALGPSEIGTNGRHGYGRINFVKFYPPNNPTQIYIGAAGGGIWRRNLDGSATGCGAIPVWQPLSDYQLSHNDLCVLGVSDLVIHPTNPDIMWVATGDPAAAPWGAFNKVSLNIYSIGIFKTENGGQDWMPWTLTGETPWMQQENGNSVRRIIMHPSNPNILYAATTNGIYKTTDGNTWTRDLPSTTGEIDYTDIEFKPNDPNTIYASRFGGKIYRSNDGGNSWTNSVGDIPYDDPNSRTEGRVELAVHPDFPNDVYALVVKQGQRPGLEGIYKSTDSGANFSQVYGQTPAVHLNLLNGSVAGVTISADPNGQGNYDLAFILDPNDPTGQTMYVGGINIWKSTNGGMSWVNFSKWDASGLFQYHPVTCISGTLDGSDPTYQRGNDSSPCPAIGSYYYDVLEFTGYDPPVPMTIELNFPNGEDAGFISRYGGSFDPATPCNFVFYGNPTTVGGSGLGTTKRTLVVSTVNPGITGNYEVTFTSPGVIPLQAEECRYTKETYVHADIHCLVFNGTDLYAGTDGGLFANRAGHGYWEDESYGLDITQYYGMSESGGNIVGGTQDNGILISENVSTKKWNAGKGGDGGECYINSGSNVIYAANNYGFIWKSVDGGASWDCIISSNEPSSDQTCPCIKPERAPLIFNALTVDENNPDIVYVGYENIYKSTNGGASCETWANITGGSSDWAANEFKVHRIEIAPSNNQVIYAIKGGALFRTQTGGGGTNSWVRIPIHLSSYPAITDIAIKDNDPNTIWISLGNYIADSKVIKAHYNGTTWTEENISGNLPNLPINTIVYEGAGKNRIYVGADVGVYYLDDDLIDTNDNACWQIFNNAYTPGLSTPLPNVIVSELEISSGNLFATTFGRGHLEIAACLRHLPPKLQCRQPA